MYPNKSASNMYLKKISFILKITSWHTFFKITNEYFYEKASMKMNY